MRYLLLLILAACAPIPNRLDSVLARTLGMPELELIQRMGPPATAYEVQGHKFLVYDYKQVRTIQGTPAQYQVTNIGGLISVDQTGGEPASHYLAACRLTFELIDQRVARYRYQGNDCRL